MRARMRRTLPGITHKQCPVSLSLLLHWWRSRLCCCSTRHTTARMRNLRCTAAFGPRWRLGCRVANLSTIVYVRRRGAGSTGRRNTGVKSLCWGFKLQGLTGSLVELTSHFVQMGLRVHRQVGALRKVLSEQAIGVLVRPALPRALRIAKIYVDFSRQRKATMIRKRKYTFGMAGWFPMVRVMRI